MSESIELPLVYTVTQTATLLGISRTHAYELVARGDLAHVRLGRRIVIPRHALEQLLNRPVAPPAAWCDRRRRPDRLRRPWRAAGVERRLNATARER